jgi:uracil-DNA glycosylase
VTADDLPAAFASVPGAWRDALPGWTAELQQQVVQRVHEVSGKRPIAPEDPFRALRLVAPAAVRVVVFGQDPYPTAGHADGLAFSAARGRPRSLARIFEVLAQDRPGFTAPAGGSLEAWARQGVLLLNPVLTVEIGRAGSHAHCGWQALTKQIVEVLCRRVDPPVFLLWGAAAQSFFTQACSASAPPPRVLRTRHPAYDFRREFMADASHFALTRELVDWWIVDAS